METITKQYEVFAFSELDENAKENARAWFRNGNDDSDTWEQMENDAKAVGLEITALSAHRNNEGEFIVSAVECMEAILKSHGPDCETYKTAQAFDAAIDAMPDSEDENFRVDDMDVAEADFLSSLLEDYRIMLDKELEYQNSDEKVDENIKANGYQFLKNGTFFNA